MTNFKVRTLVAAVATAALGLGFASQASAAQTFDINPTAIGAANGSFTADKIDFSTSELLHLSADAMTATGSGYGTASSFDLASNIVKNTGLNGSYGVYFTFTLTDTYDQAKSKGLPGQPNSVYDLQSLTFTFYADKNNDTTFLQAHSGKNGEPTNEATVTGNTSDDIILATGTLLGGTAGFNDQGGAALNGTNTFNTTTTGMSFFAKPVPFYNMVMSEFNNTSTGLEVNGNLIAITQATGAVDFSGSTNVPEPASLMLLGVGLVGLGASVQRRKSKA